ncbi:unnamed protein product [Laminaria digitata]
MDSARATEALLNGVLAESTTRVEAALEDRANVDGSSALFCTPIMAATLQNSAGMVSLLLEHGADPDRPSDHFIASQHHPGKTLVTPGERALHLAARRGDIYIVPLLLKHARADPNAADTLGRTPLMMACASEQNHIVVVRLLLEAGADPAVSDDGGYTALHLAARHGRFELVNMLYAGAPATLTKHTGDGHTPLAFACSYGHERMASRLISKGAMAWMILDENQSWPLKSAVSGGFVSIVRLLLEQWAGVVQDPDCFPEILCTAVRKNYASILRMLLSADGEDVQSYWTNTEFGGMQLLHCVALPTAVPPQ